MARLFDETRRRQAEMTVRTTREEARQRAAEVEALLAEYEENDASSKGLSEQLAASRAKMTGGSIKAIFYKEYREPGSKWMIEHSENGPDYIFQVHPIKPVKLNWQDIITMMVFAMDRVFPRNMQCRYIRPSEQYQLKFYTIKIEKLVGFTGWSKAVERALAGLSGIDAWPKY